MPLHYRFFIAGIVFVLLGMLLGMWMGMNENFTYAPVHAHLNLLGWATMFLFGLYYRGNPAAERGMWPQIQWWCAVLGLVILAPGIWASQTHGTLTWLTIPGSLLSFASMVIFLIVVIRSAGKARPAV